MTNLRSYLGIKRILVDGTHYDLDWGSHAVKVSGDGQTISIDNASMARALGSAPLHEVVRREIARNA
jgi:hypothetical protein